MEDLKKGDLIVALGCSLTDKGITKRHKVLAEVLEVGRYDLFAMTGDTGSVLYSSKIFKIPKSRCVKVVGQKISFEAETTKPKLGDLVVYLRSSMGTVDRKTGVLMEIIDYPDRAKCAKLLVGSKTEIITYDDLIVMSH